MAKFSDTFIQGLLNPSYSKRLGDAAEGIGAMPGMMMAEKSRVKSQAEIQRLLQQYANDPAQLTAMSQKYAAGGNKEAAKLFQDAATRATAKREGRGKGELMALANNPKFDITDQKMQGGYFGMANAFDVSREEAMEIALEAVENRKDKNGDYRKTDQVTIRDSENNEFIQFSVQNINDPESTPVTKTVPVGNSPPKPVGKTQIISKTTGASAFDKPEIASDVRTAQEFADLKVEATSQLPELMSQSRILDDAVSALDTMESQGLPEVIVNTIRSEFGVQDPDIAQYEMLVGELMFARLKPLFGGVISEGEREAIVGLYANMKRGNPANKAILMQLKKKIQETIVKANLIRRSESFGDYNLSLDRMYPTEEEETEQNVVDFRSLPTQG